MHNTALHYLHLQPDGELPPLENKPPFKAILIIDDEVSEMWRWEVCRWLVEKGCRYLMAWGRESEAWKESVEDACLEANDYEDVPEDKLVIASSHEDEELSDVFWFSKHRAHHPAHELKPVWLLHVAAEARQEALFSEYEDA
jgi:hypothetical protein